MSPQRNACQGRPIHRSTQAASRRAARHQRGSAGHLRGTRRANSTAGHHERRLHLSQHVGMPQHAILAREATVQRQKKAKRPVAWLRASRPRQLRERGRCISPRLAWSEQRQRRHTMAEAARQQNRGESSPKGKVSPPVPTQDNRREHEGLRPVRVLGPTPGCSRSSRGGVRRIEGARVLTLAAYTGRQPAAASASRLARHAQGRAAGLPKGHPPPLAEQVAMPAKWHRSSILSGQAMAGA